MSWTAERRKRQAELIQNWRPWDKSTGPITPEGKDTVSKNPWKGGQREQLRELARMLRFEMHRSRELLSNC